MIQSRGKRRDGPEREGAIGHGALRVGDLGSVFWKDLGEMAVLWGSCRGGTPWRLNLRHSEFES